jgi:hypothetical protein
MGFFTKKSHISTQNAQIGEQMPNGDIVWNIADFEYAWDMYKAGVLEDRGSITVNGIHYKRYYLPPPSIQYP